MPQAPKVLESDSKIHLESGCCAILIYTLWLTGPAPPALWFKEVLAAPTFFGNLRHLSLRKAPWISDDEVRTCACTDAASCGMWCAAASSCGRWCTGAPATVFFEKQETKKEVVSLPKASFFCFFFSADKDCKIFAASIVAVVCSGHSNSARLCIETNKLSSRVDLSVKHRSISDPAPRHRSISDAGYCGECRGAGSYMYWVC